MTKSEAGRIGGQTTLLRHGREHYSRIGAQGGRPRARTITRQQTAPANLMNGGKATQQLFSLKKLKELYKEKRGE